MGRVDKYETHVKPYLDDIPKWYERMNEAQIVKRLGIGVTSFNKYKKEHPELKAALKKGKQELSDELFCTLKKKALGYKYTEKKTIMSVKDGKKYVTTETYDKYAQPDLGSIHLLLKNINDDWHNDDKSILTIKKKELELREKQIENNSW